MRTKLDLMQMQSLPLYAKVRKTQMRIREWYEYYEGNVYVSFSGGKDSTVLKYIVEQMYDDVPSVFVNTGLEYPEVQKFAMSQDNVVVVRPKMRFDEVVKTYGYPIVSKEQAQYIREARTTKSEKLRNRRINGDANGKFKISERHKKLLNAPFDVSEQCCKIMKKNPAKEYEKTTGRKAFIGTLATESTLRMNSWVRNGCNAFESKRPTSQPLSFWTEQDILQYIYENELPIASVYGNVEKGETYTLTGVDRTGCIFCGFGCHMDKSPTRFERLKVTHPRQYEYCIGGGQYVDGVWKPSKDGLGLAIPLDYIGVKY